MEAESQFERNIGLLDDILSVTGEVRDTNRRLSQRLETAIAASASASLILRPAQLDLSNIAGQNQQKKRSAKRKAESTLEERENKISRMTLEEKVDRVLASMVTKGDMDKMTTRIDKRLDGLENENKMMANEQKVMADKQTKIIDRIERLEEEGRRTNRTDREVRRCLDEDATNMSMT